MSTTLQEDYIKDVPVHMCASVLPLIDQVTYCKCTIEKLSLYST